MDRLVKKDVKRRYEKMLKDYSEQGENQGKVNCYTCEQCGQVTKTINKDNGVTPMGIECPYCHANAASSFYHDIAPNIEVTHEWYRPTLEETWKMATKNQLMSVYYILNGGLLRRPCCKS